MQDIRNASPPSDLRLLVLLLLLLPPLLLLLSATPHIMHLLQARSNTREVVAVFSQVDMRNASGACCAVAACSRPAG
jgi:hypothetical protein